MLSDEFNCSVCFIQFDRTDHIPICGHTICSRCLTDILGKQKECPVDRRKFSQIPKETEHFPTNRSLLKLLDENLNGEYGTCSKPGKPKYRVCTNDYAQICDDCATLNHLGHSTRSVKELRVEAEDKKKKLEAFIDEFDVQREEIEGFLKDAKKSPKTVVISEFDKVREVIMEKEKELLNEIEFFFEAQKEEIEVKLKEDNSVKDKYEAKISDLENKMNTRFFKNFTKSEKRSLIFRSNRFWKILKKQVKNML